MLVALVCEGTRDSEPLRVLIERTLNEIVSQPPLGGIQFKKPFTADGPIFTKLQAGVSVLLMEPRPQLIVLYSDIDKYPDRKSELTGWIRGASEISIYTPFTVEPHFEELFFAEGNSMIRALRLSPTEPILYEEMSEQPKNRLDRIIYRQRENHIIEPEVTREDIYIDIVSGMNLDTLANRSRDFHNFQQELRNFCGNH